MKLLAFSDVHADEDRIGRLIKKAKKFKVDALLSAGDLSHFGSGIEEMFKKLNIGLPLFIVPGNHESPKQIENAEKRYKFIRNLHAKTQLFDSILFFGCGGSSFTPFGTPYELSEEELTKLLSKFDYTLKEKATKFVLITHESPYNTKLDTLSPTHHGSKAVRNFIEKNKPNCCICGHFHENAGKQDKIDGTIIINPGYEGRVIEI